MRARQQGDEPPGHWRLGVPLPPAQGKQRLAFSVPPSAVRHWRQPLRLEEVRAAAPPDWQPALHALQTQAAALELTPAVYGAFAWQALTGLAYVTPHSDLDLLWHPQSRAQLAALLALLPAWETASGRRADGEVLLSDGSSVCWRELAGPAAQVLVKTLDKVTLRPRAALLAGLPV